MQILRKIFLALLFAFLVGILLGLLIRARSERAEKHLSDLNLGTSVVLTAMTQKSYEDQTTS